MPGLRAGGETLTLQAPFPWFGGKSRIADVVWQRFGNVTNYVEPFYGSGAVHLLRPKAHMSDGIWPLETINDYDGYVSNFWRAIKHAPDEVAEWADWPVNENDLHARHYWLLERRDSLRAMLEGDPDYYDTKIAGWWVWGMSVWIGSGFCSGSGPWQSVDGRLVKSESGRGVQRKLVHLGNSGMGVQRKLVHLGAWFEALSMRLSRVRVASGDWSRVCGLMPTFKQGLTGVFLDPPYGEEANRDSDIYSHDSLSLAADVRSWCLDNGDNPLLRIALCGYDGEHNELERAGWSVYEWSALGGYGSQRTNGTNENRHRERIWFSPACLGQFDHLPLFAASR